MTNIIVLCVSLAALLVYFFWADYNHYKDQD